MSWLPERRSVAVKIERMWLAEAVLALPLLLVVERS
jgi:hypothetical protein